jgi:type I restriction enzyme S subunit
MYLYYYLTINDFSKLGSGMFAKGSLNKKSLGELKIPIPSIVRQQEIVEECDQITKSIDTIKLRKEQLKSDGILFKKYYKKNVLDEIYKNSEIKTLSEVCEVNPENMKVGQYTEINYIDIGSVKGGQILELQKLTNDFPSRAKRIVKKGDILYSSVRPNLKGYVYISDDIQNGIASTGFANIRVKEQNIILSKYLYYIMTSDYITDYLINKAKGAQYPAVSFDDFETIKIPIPSLENQEIIIAYYEQMNDEYKKHILDRIEEYNKELEMLKDLCVNMFYVS